MFEGKANQGLKQMRAVSNATPKPTQKSLIPFKIMLLKLSKENVKKEMAQIMEYTPDVQAYAWNCFADMFETPSDQIEARRRGLDLPSFKWHLHAEYKLNYAEWLFMLSNQHTEAISTVLSIIQDAMTKNPFQNGSCDVSTIFSFVIVACFKKPLDSTEPIKVYRPGLEDCTTGLRKPQSGSFFLQVMTVTILIRAHLLLYHMAQSETDEFEHLMSAYGTALEVAHTVLQNYSEEDKPSADEAADSSAPNTRGIKLLQILP